MTQTGCNQQTAHKAQTENPPTHLVPHPARHPRERKTTKKTRATTLARFSHPPKWPQNSCIPRTPACRGPLPGHALQRAKTDINDDFWALVILALRNACRRRAAAAASSRRAKPLPPTDRPQPPRPFFCAPHRRRKREKTVCQLHLCRALPPLAGR